MAEDVKLGEILIPERTQYLVMSEESKKRVLETISTLLGENLSEINTKDIFVQLNARERLGSTAIGHGVAIPHARIADLPHPIGCLVLLNKGIDYNSLDKQMVDIFFGLLVPEDANQEHLNLLATLAESFSQKQFCQQLREAKDSQTLYQVFQQHYE